MSRFLNAGKKHMKIAAVMLAAAIALPTVGCASQGASGTGNSAQAGQEQAAGSTAAAAAESAAVKESESGAGAAEDAAKNAGAGSSAGASAKKEGEEEGAGAAAAKEAAKNAGAGSSAGASAKKEGEEEGAGAAAAEAVKQGSTDSKTGKAAKKASESASENADTAKSGSKSEKKSSGGASGEEESIAEAISVREDGGVSMNVFAMDTYVTLLAYGDKAEKAVEAAAKEIHELDAMLSTGIKTSEICKINAAGSGEPSEEVEELVSESLELAEKTDGLFNIAIYPVMKLWGFPTKEYKVPEQAKIEKALKLADLSSVKLVTREDVEEAQKAAAAAAEKAAEEAAEKAVKKAEAAEKASDAAKGKAAGTDKKTTSAEKKTAAGEEKTAAETEAAKLAAEEAAKTAAQKAAAEKLAEAPKAPSITFEKKGMAIDLGGIAKGFAADRVGKIFDKYNIESGVISLGGNVQVFGVKKNGKPWKVAIQNPENPVEYLGVLDVEDKAVVTSGGYERCFEENGVTYHHIIDPRTGCPADSGLLSVTVICDKGMVADGLSTALFIMGKDQAEAFRKEFDEKFDYILEDKNGTLYVTEGIADSLVTDAYVVTVGN